MQYQTTRMRKCMFQSIQGNLSLEPSLGQIIFLGMFSSPEKISMINFQKSNKSCSILGIRNNCSLLAIHNFYCFCCTRGGAKVFKRIRGAEYQVWNYQRTNYANRNVSSPSYLDRFWLKKYKSILRWQDGARGS